MCVYMYKCLASKVAENAFEAFLRIKKRKSNRDLTKKSESWERKIKYMNTCLDTKVLSKVENKQIN